MENIHNIVISRPPMPNEMALMRKQNTFSNNLKYNIENFNYCA